MTLGKQRRGFALLSPERRREISSKGGKSLTPAMRSFSQNRALAVEAGAKGGKASKGGGRPAGSVTPEEKAERDMGREWDERRENPALWEGRGKAK